MDQLAKLAVMLGWVALGSVLGGSARFLVSGFVGRRIGESFPWGTLTVNASGAFAIGVVAALIVEGPHSQPAGLWQLVAVGFLGSYTTVSSFSLQTLALARDGEYLRAAGNTLLSIAACLLAVALGFAVARGAGSFGAP